MSLQKYMKSLFKHLKSVQYFLEAILPDLLSGDFTNQAQLQKISQKILTDTKI